MEEIYLETLTNTRLLLLDILKEIEYRENNDIFSY